MENKNLPPVPHKVRQAVDKFLPRKDDRSAMYAACQALKEGKRLKLVYHPQGKPDEDRVVEVHALGLSTKGEPCMRVFQVQGGAVFGEHTGWKMLSMKDVSYPTVLEDDTEGPRPGYSPGDKGMMAILAEISNEPVPQP